MTDLHHVPTLGLSIMAAFWVVAPRYGVRLDGIEDDANEHSDFWQQVAAEIITAATPPTPAPQEKP
jgi:hypothetical protein